MDGRPRADNIGMDSLTERLVACLLRAAASAMTFAGAAALIATVPVLGFASAAPEIRAIGAIVLQIAAVFLAAGIAARFLGRFGASMLPHERPTAAGSQRPGGNGLLSALAIFLVAIPVWLLFRLEPFLAEWNSVVRFFASSDIWDSANANMSGVVLLPLAGALTPPFLELVTVACFIVTSALLLPLLLTRSWRFPRMYLVCAVLLTALVIASVRGVEGARSAADAVQELVETSNARPEEATALRDGITRYMTIVTSTASPLAWASFGYVAWLVPLLSSRHAQAFRQTVPREAAGVESITSPPRFPAG
jgi:hypothetical protein